MPRNSSGTYTLPVAAFVPGGLIKSADDNSNFSDIATAITQSLATTGVSTMTGSINAAAGAVNAPGYAFTGASKTGFYLASSNQIGWTANGVEAATFNSDTSVTFAGPISGKGCVPIGAVMDFAGSTAPTGWLLCYGQLVSTTTYASLFSVLSTTYGSGSGTFGIPDYRGRTLYGQDNMGGSAANRITATTNYDGTVLGNSGGLQTFTLLTASLPPYTPSGTNSSVGVTVTSSATFAEIPGGNPGLTGSASVGITQSAVTSTGTVAGQTFTGVAQGGTSTPFSVLGPSIITNKIIYAGV